jgi:hypothetical protein
MDEVERKGGNARHITVFTGDLGLFEAGTAVKGVLPEALKEGAVRHPGKGLSFIGSSILFAPEVIIAHEWGHTFSLDDAGSTIVRLPEVFLPNLMNAAFPVPGLTITQAKRANEYARSHY